MFNLIMKHLKLANSIQDFQSKQNIQKCNKTHVVVYERSDEEYDNLVTAYENSPEECNYVYPKQVLVNYKKQLKCKMEYSWYINSSNKLEIKIKITDIDSKIYLNSCVLVLESDVAKKSGKRIWQKITEPIDNLKLNTEYIISSFIYNRFIGRGKSICNFKQISYNNFNIEWKVRPALLHIGSSKYSNERLHGTSEFDNIIETQDPLIIKCTLDKV